MRESVERIKLKKYENIACCEYKYIYIICLYSFTVHLIATYLIGPTGLKGSNRIMIKKRNDFIGTFIENTAKSTSLLKLLINIFNWFRLLFQTFLVLILNFRDISKLKNFEMLFAKNFEQWPKMKKKLAKNGQSGR